MKKFLFIICALIAIYCAGFGVCTLLMVEESARWYFFFPCIFASLFYGYFAWEKRPWNYGF